uniref:WAT1-related protein n=1 Tax=Kalanchoe fedtschenkoi TaxID=63787 RepID=A0A7N0VI59_KALFE
MWTMMGISEGLGPPVAMVLLEVIYSGMFILSKMALVDGLSIRVFVVYRQAVATLVLAPAAYFSSSCSLTWKSFWWIFLSAFVGATMNQNLALEGLYLASASVTCATSNLIPAITFVLSYFVGLEKLDFRSPRSYGKIIGTVVCITGAMVMDFLRGSKLLNAATASPILVGPVGERDWIVGCVCMIAYVFCWPIWLILQVPIIKCHPNHISASAWTCAFSVLQSAVVALVIDRDSRAWILKPNIELAACIYTGVFATGVAFFVQSWSISIKGPAYSAMFNPLSTVIVTIIESLFLQEALYIGRYNTVLKFMQLKLELQQANKVGRAVCFRAVWLVELL